MFINNFAHNALRCSTRKYIARLKVKMLLQLQIRVLCSALFKRIICDDVGDEDLSCTKFATW
jgi:hypothetical protein